MYVTTKKLVFSDLCDLWICISSMGFVKSNDGLLGLCGMTSSLIGVSQQWKATRCRLS